MTRPDAVFDDENDAFQHIRARLAETLPEALATAVSEQFEVYCGLGAPLADWPTVFTDSSESSEPRFYIGAPFLGPWTVREQDVNDIVTLAPLAWAISTSEAGKHLDPVVKLIMAAACMIWRLRRRGVSVSPLQRDLLLLLRRSRAISFEKLVRQAESMSTEWTREEVSGALQELRAVRLNDGTVVALVHQAEDGLWSTDARGLWEVPFGSG